MNRPLNFDVVVVGAGPAGSAAALALSRGGLSVAIVEKAVLPRHKTCGGGLLGRTLQLLPLDVRSVVERECFTAELQHHHPRIRFSTSRAQPVVSMVMRDRFDHLLTSAAQSAGARLFAGTPVTDVAIHPDKVEIKTGAGVITSRFVIAADGVGSVVARKCGLPELRNVVPALECEVTVEAEIHKKFQDSARFDFGLIPHGYAWVFPKREHLSIGVLTTRRGSCNLNEEYARYLGALGLTAVVKEERHGYMIPLRPRDGLFNLPRILYVGDAAGLADPVMAEGISGAILSGQIAGKAILDHRQDDLAVMPAFRAELQRTILSELRVARTLAYVLYNFPSIRGWLFQRQGQPLAEFMTRLVMGNASYRGAVRSPLNYLKLIGAGSNRRDVLAIPQL